jgi:class 3 adenylate cyclase
VDDRHLFSGIIRDITERKTAEHALHLANKSLNEKNAQLEALSVKLAKYLSRQVYDSIFEGRTDVQVKSYRKELTVFFSDIEGFTDLTDRLEAEVLSDLLNTYLSEMSRIADECGGTVDKFIGDGVMIFFGDPETRGRKEDAVACVRMAMRMRKRAGELRNSWADVIGPQPLHIRLGINTGYCTVGNFGSEDRLDYTIVGGAVNVASRLEDRRAGPNTDLAHHICAGQRPDLLQADRRYPGQGRESRATHLRGSWGVRQPPSQGSHRSRHRGFQLAPGSIGAQSTRSRPGAPGT